MFAIELAAQRHEPGYVDPVLVDDGAGRIGRLSHAVPGHAELVVGQTPERTRESDGCAAVTELVDDDGRVVLGQAHVETGPLPGHRPGQPGHLHDAEVRAHPRPALADAAGGVVDDQYATHPRLAVGDAYDLLRAPIVHELEGVEHEDGPFVVRLLVLLRR
jgi:hypothetical protein